MKKVALISPKGNVFGKNEKMVAFLNQTSYMESFRFLWTGPNLALLTIGAMLPTDWECVYLDENYAPIDYSQDYDLVCLSAMTQQAINAYAIADRFREMGVPVVLGGVHATLMPGEASRHADGVVIGEAEVSWPDVLQDYTCGTLKNVYRDARPGTYDLSNSPLPRYELMQGYHYPLVSLQTTRGCPHECSFCAASRVFGHQYRRKRNAQIMKELSTLSEMYPGTLILFADDNLFVKREECKSLLRDMVGMNLRWIAQTDVSVAQDPSLLRLMTQAGCQWVVIGFESVSYESLHNLDEANWKLKQFHNYRTAIETIQSFGIGVYGTFIVGLDQDGPDVFQSTASFIMDNNLYGANITVPTPLPGTRLREDLVNSGRVLDRNWSFYTFWDVTFQPKQFTVEELEDGLVQVYRAITDKSAVERRLVQLRKLSKRKKLF